MMLRPAGPLAGTAAARRMNGRTALSAANFAFLRMRRGSQPLAARAARTALCFP